MLLIVGHLDWGRSEQIVVKVKAGKTMHYCYFSYQFVHNLAPPGLLSSSENNLGKHIARFCKINGSYQMCMHALPRGKILSPFLVHSMFTVDLQMVNYSGYGQLSHRQYSLKCGKQS